VQIGIQRVQKANPTQLMAGVIWGLRDVKVQTGIQGVQGASPLTLVAHTWRLGRAMGIPCEAREDVAGQGNSDGGGRWSWVRRRQRRREVTTVAVRMQRLGLARGLVLCRCGLEWLMEVRRWRQGVTDDENGNRSCYRGSFSMTESWSGKIDGIRGKQRW